MSVFFTSLLSFFLAGGEMRAEWRWGAEKHLDSFVYILVVYFFSPLVTGAIYEFNSKTGARKWKDSLTQMPKWKESSPQGAAPRRPVPQEGTRTPRSTDKERDGLSIKVQAEDAGLGPRSQDSMPSTPKNRNSAFTRGASPKQHPEK